MGTLSVELQNHIILWLPFYKELERLFGILPGEYHEKANAAFASDGTALDEEIVMEVMKMGYVSMMSTLEKYPLWNEEVSQVVAIRMPWYNGPRRAVS